jgi:NitT/TauT family transport system permease protein
MTVDIESGMSRATDLPARKPVPAAVRRRQRVRSAAIILATQGALLALLLGFWDYMTANNKQAAFMFGSPSAIAGFLGQMIKDGSLWRDSYVT